MSLQARQRLIQHALANLQFEFDRYKSTRDRAISALEELALGRRVSTQVINADIVQRERIEGMIQIEDDSLPAYEPLYEQSQEQGQGQSATTFEHSLPPLPLAPPPDYSPRKLDKPVVIPQTRLNDLRSSFMVSYAPTLQLNGIDRETFTNFLQTFNSALRDSAILQVIGIAGFMVRLDPGMNTRSPALESNTRADSYLQHANVTIFQPRGLLAMVISDNVRSNIIGPTADLESSTAIIPSPSPTPIPRPSSSSASKGSSSFFGTIAKRLVEAHDFLEACAINAQDTVDDYTLKTGQILGPQSGSLDRYPSKFQSRLDTAQARYDSRARRQERAAQRLEHVIRYIARTERQQLASGIRNQVGPLYLVIVNDVLND